MLESITVKNLALIKESEVVLKPGLNIMTGETGAGKSIILGSIRLALGERAGKDIIRRGADYALIELSFVTKRKDVLDKMRELDIPTGEDGTIIIGRRIQESRSVCKCNGETISNRALKEIASMLIDIHGQNDTQTLLDVKNYRDILDDFDDNLLPEIESMKSAYKEYRQLKTELDEAASNDSNKDKDLALARFEVDEIEAARLTEGEDEDLEERFRLMKNAQKIAESLGKAYAAINMDSGAGSAVSEALREVDQALQYDDNVTDVSSTLATIEDMLGSVARDISSYMDDMEFSDEEYHEVTERLNIYNHLKSKYGDTVTKIIEYMEERKSYIEKMDDYDSYIAELKVRVDKAHSEAMNQARSLHDFRCKAAKRLEEMLINNLVDLNFADVTLHVECEAAEDKLSEYGMDVVDFKVSFNIGEPVRSLSQVASGGELSRFMLALKAVTADKESIETLVFDEIDTGISGKTAWNVSEKMAVIGKDHQVIAITHLPQIAAMAQSHYLIEKNVVDETTITDIRRLDDEEREHEIARMLSGGELSEAGLINARELLDNASKVLYNN